MAAAITRIHRGKIEKYFEESHRCHICYCSDIVRHGWGLGLLFVAESF